MRRVELDEAFELISWLGRPPWTSEVNRGYDRDDWADSTWVLHAMFELDAMDDVTHQELRRQAVEEGAVDPLITGDAASPEELLAALRK